MFAEIMWHTWRWGIRGAYECGFFGVALLRRYPYHAIDITFYAQSPGVGNA